MTNLKMVPETKVTGPSSSGPLASDLKVTDPSVTDPSVTDLKASDLKASDLKVTGPLVTGPLVTGPAPVAAQPVAKNALQAATQPEVHYTGPYDLGYASVNAVGIDLRANFASPEAISPHETKIVPTGIAVAIPVGYEGQVRVRSSVAVRGLIIANSPGTIDPDYRGEVKLILHNLTDDYIVVESGERLAQLVIVPAIQACLNRVASLEATDRGSGGLGSTGRLA